MAVDSQCVKQSQPFFFSPERVISDSMLQELEGDVGGQPVSSLVQEQP